MNVNRPTQNEKDIAIDNILKKGLQKPISACAYFRELFQMLGIRFIFWDSANVLILSIILIIGMTILGQSFLTPEYKHSTLFGASPLLFVILMSLIETMEHESRLYELKMTCKYTIRQITAFRILCFSIIGIAFSTGITIYHSVSVKELFHLLPLSFSAFFLCSSVCLFFISRFMGKWIYAISTIVWALIATLPAFIFTEKWEQFLSEIPIFMTMCIAVFLSILSFIEMKKFMFLNKKEVAYVIG